MVLKIEQILAIWEKKLLNLWKDHYDKYYLLKMNKLFILFQLCSSPMKLLIISKIKRGRSSQNFILFIRGYAISGLSNIKKTRKCSKCSIISDITIKKIIMKRCVAIIVLNIWLLINDSQVPSSKWIIILIDEPNQLRKKKWNIIFHISSWFE